MARVFEKVHAIQGRVVERILEHKSVGMLWHADDLGYKTGLMVSPTIIRTHVFPFYDLTYTLTLGTPAEVDAEVKERIRVLAPGGGYCLSSANSIPDYVPFENLIAMRDAWIKYGGYPIELDSAPSALDNPTVVLHNIIL